MSEVSNVTKPKKCSANTAPVNRVKAPDTSAINKTVNNSEQYSAGSKRKASAEQVC